MLIIQIKEGSDAVTQFAEKFGPWIAIAFVLLFALMLFVYFQMKSDKAMLKETIDNAREETKGFLKELEATRATYLTGQTRAIEGQAVILQEIRELRKRRTGGN